MYMVLRCGYYSSLEEAHYQLAGDRLHIKQALQVVEKDKEAGEVLALPDVAPPAPLVVQLAAAGDAVGFSVAAHLALAVASRRKLFCRCS